MSAAAERREIPASGVTGAVPSLARHRHLSSWEIAQSHNAVIADLILFTVSPRTPPDN